MADNRMNDKLNRFKTDLKTVLGDVVRKPISARLGYVDQDGEVFLQVPTNVADQPSQYYFSSAGGQTFVGQAYLQDGVIAEWQLRYGAPIRIKKDVINGTWEIVGLDVIYSSEYFDGVDPSNFTIIPLRRFAPGLLTSTTPESLKARVLEGVYDVGDSFRYYPTQDTLDWGVAPNNAQVPELGQAVFVLVQIDPDDGSLSYKYGAAVTSAMTFTQAYQYQVTNGVSTILPEKDSGQFRCGYIKLVGGQTAITRLDNIWSIQQILGAPSNVEDQAVALFSRFVTDGEDVVVADGEVVYVDAEE